MVPDPRSEESGKKRETETSGGGTAEVERSLREWDPVTEKGKL
jgi:hypothetical protein